MKIIAIVIALICGTGSARAVDEAAPSPTPVYLKHHARPGSHRRQGQAERRRDLELKSEARAEAKANRRNSTAAGAQAKAAARAREQAQRQLAVQARSEAANATPRATSDLMSRMGFSEQEIAMQKAREQSAEPGSQKVSPAASSSPPSREIQSDAAQTRAEARPKIPETPDDRPTPESRETGTGSAPPPGRENTPAPEKDRSER